MSRIDKNVAERNSSVLKGLLRLPENKLCVDCKRNAHPRWASWPLGVFLCIRCSGIHRSMGTHVSRVKSVDLDAWSDEQVQSMRHWGNERANLYWEANLAEGHVPPESKMENFIRTKYESKRWVMKGGLPDPATLVGPERASSVPLRQEKVMTTATKPVPAPPQSTPPLLQSRPKTERGESLLGLDFDAPPISNSSSSAPPRPPSSRASERSDLKTSILSLYANKSPPAASEPMATMPSSGLEGFESLSIKPKSGSKTPKETYMDVFAPPPLSPPTPTVQTSNDVFAGLRGLSDEPLRPRAKARDSFQSLMSSRKASATSTIDDGPTIDTSIRTTRLSLAQNSPNPSSPNTETFPSPNSSIRSTRPRQKSSQLAGDEFGNFESSQGNDEDLFSNVWK